MGIALPSALLVILGVIAAAALIFMVFVYVLVPVLKGVGWLIAKVFWFIGAAIAHLFRFVAGMFRDTFRAIGAVPAAFIFAFLAVGTVVIGRWSSAAHFASNMQKEFKTFGGCIYRVALGHPLRLIGLHPMLEGIEQRVPAAMAEVPGPEKPSRRTGKFDGYEIVGSLPGGGSGGRLYVASPNIEKRGQITKALGECPERVVIKAFAVADGSSLPQIVRESRALECAKQLGLILDHELGEERFYYVMPFVPGDNLAAVARGVHGRSGDAGLKENDVRLILSYIGDVLNTLDTYHRGGLWHKDIKPENIIISEDGRAHVVDLGLVTPLRSAMTLTTHGTEYFRDPEMVRMALKGVKVHEVDGTRFDIYAAGAVLFYMLENTFPSHGGLSTISRRCPDAVKWIVRRAMTDYSKRYEHVSEMYEDIKAVATNPQMFAMKPADLPSLRGSANSSMASDLHEAGAAAAGAVGMAAGHEQHDRKDEAPESWEEADARIGPAPEEAGFAGPWNRRPDRKKFRFKVTNWWTGAYEPLNAGDAQRQADADDIRVEVRRAGSELRTAARQAAAHAQHAVQQVRQNLGRQGHGEVDAHGDFVGQSAKYGSPAPGAAVASMNIPAQEQVHRARSRAADLRKRARQRGSTSRRVHAPGERLTPALVIAASFVFAFLALCVLGALGVMSYGSGRSRGMIAHAPTVRIDIPDTPQIIIGGDNQADGIVETWDGETPADVAIAGSVDGERIVASPEAIRKSIGLDLPADFPMGFIVINDHPQPSNEEVRAQENSAADLVAALGFGSVVSEQDEALIRARAEQWLSGPYSITPGDELDRAETAVGDLLEAEIDEVGCVLWLYPIADRPQDVGYWVITPDAVNSEIDDKILSFVMGRSR